MAKNIAYVTSWRIFLAMYKKFQQCNQFNFVNDLVVEIEQFHTRRPTFGKWINFNDTYQLTLCIWE